MCIGTKLGLNEENPTYVNMPESTILAFLARTPVHSKHIVNNHHKSTARGT